MYSGHGRCLYNIQRSVCICFVLLHWLIWYGDVAETQDKDFPVEEPMKSERMSWKMASPMYIVVVGGP